MVLLESRYDTLKQGNNALDFTLTSVNGRKFTFSDAEGYSGYLIIFMCNHCPYVQPKMESVVKLQEEFPKIMFIGINANTNPEYPEDSFEKMEEYADKWSLNFDYLIDETQEIAKKYGATCTPDPFLFNAKKELVYHGRFDPEHGKASDCKDMRDAIKKMLAGKKVSDDKMFSLGCSIKWNK